MARYEQKTEIALYGFYRFGNFGDDLAGIIFGRHLKELGVKVRIYGLCREHADAFGFTVADTVEELLQGVDGVVLGGGSMLMCRRWPPRFYFGMLGHLPEIIKTGEKLIDLVRSKKIPFFCLSVGGDGRVGEPLTPSYKRRFLEAAEFISVRNRSDLDILKYHGRTGTYYPDIIWQTASFFPPMPKREDRIRVGVNLYPSNLLGLNFFYAVALRMIVRRRPEVDFIFIESAHATKNRFGAVALPARYNVQRYIFRDIKEDLEMISSLDLLISSRLHLGVAAMSYGVPFMSVGGEGKTRTLFSEAGIEEMCFDIGDILRFIRLFRDSRQWKRFLENSVLPDVSALRAQSRGHLEELKRIVSSIQRKDYRWSGRR